MIDKTSFKQWNRRYKLAAGVKGERFKVPSGETSASTIVPESSNVVGERKNAQHWYASLLMSTECGGDSSNINLMSKIWKPANKGEIENSSFPIEK